MLYMTPYHSKYEHNLPFGLSAPSSPIFKRPLTLALHLYERCSNRELQHEFWVALSSYLMHVFNPLVSGATELHSPVKYGPEALVLLPPFPQLLSYVVVMKPKPLGKALWRSGGLASFGIKSFQVCCKNRPLKTCLEIMPNLSLLLLPCSEKGNKKVWQVTITGGIYSFLCRMLAASRRFRSPAFLLDVRMDRCLAPQTSSPFPLVWLDMYN